jgi:hypothetical protein
MSPKKKKKTPQKPAASKSATAGSTTQKPSSSPSSFASASAASKAASGAYFASASTAAAPAPKPTATPKAVGIKPDKATLKALLTRDIEGADEENVKGLCVHTIASNRVGHPYAIQFLYQWFTSANDNRTRARLSWPQVSRLLVCSAAPLNPTHSIEQTCAERCCVM